MTSTRPRGYSRRLARMRRVSAPVNPSLVPVLVPLVPRLLCSKLGASLGYQGGGKGLLIRIIEYVVHEHCIWVASLHGDGRSEG